MVKVIVIFLIVAAVVIIDILYFSGVLVRTGNEWKGYEIIRYHLNNKQYHLLVADTPAKRSKGLMYVKNLKGVDGMIFKFDNLAPQSFWNQNTHLDLDIYWINGDTVVGYEHLPPIDRAGMVVISSPRPVDTVIEIARKK